MMTRACVWGSLLLTAAGVVADETPFMKGRRFAAADYSSGKVCVVEADGSVSWTQKAPNSNDLWILPGGSVLFTTGHGVKEVCKDGAVKFAYQSQAEIFAVQRLANGNTFVGECTSGRLLELTPEGKIAKDLALLPAGKAGGHAYIRNARALANGHFLVCHYGGRYVAEYAADGTVVWTHKTPGGPHSAARLASGNTLIACGDNGTPCLIEVNPEGQTVWQVSNADLPEQPFKFLTGFQKLPNGNVLMVVCFLASASNVWGMLRNSDMKTILLNCAVMAIGVVFSLVWYNSGKVTPSVSWESA